MEVPQNVSACAGHPNAIRSLEHVQVRLSLTYSRRGDLEISLVSPMGTQSTLVAIRCAVSQEGSSTGGDPPRIVPAKPFGLSVCLSQTL